jgi:hypothetical protein
MKKYITILIGVVVLFAVLYGGRFLMKDRNQADVTDVTSSVLMKSVTGQVMRMFEGEHVIDYSFKAPESSTTTVEMDGALVRVTDAMNPVVSIYFSYEGGRGYAPLDYIDNVIAPHVAIIEPTSTSTVGAYDWQGAESEGSEWHVAQVLGGQWLVVVENKKTEHDTVNEILSSFEVK